MKKIIILTISLIIVAAAFACAFLHSEKAVAATTDYVPATVEYNGEVISTDAWVFSGTPYISLDVFKKYADCSCFTINKSDCKIYFDLSKLNMYIADEDTTNFIKKYGGQAYIYIKQIYSKEYVALNVISQFGKLGYRLDGTTITISPYSNKDGVACITADSVVGVSSIISGNGTSVAFTKGQTVFIEGETAFSYKIKDLDGNICYVKKSVVAEGSIESLYDFSYTAKTKNTYNEKINFVWYNMAGTTLEVPTESGIDIISPTWFRQIVKGNGTVYNYGNKGFVDLCHQQGMEVWVTVNNSMTTSGSTAYTTTVLSDEDLRNKVIAQYLFYCALYNVDGINVDYEDLSTKNGVKAKYVSFITEMSKYTNKMGLQLAVSTPVPGEYNELIYDFEGLGKAADYITLMTYDQNYSKSNGAGSNASYIWDKTAVLNLLNYVDSEKILLGLPFYTRVWTLNSSGSAIGMVSVKMGRARELVSEAANSQGESIVKWDVTSRQYIATYKGNEGTVKIWLESERSLANKLTLVYTYNLAGSCCWEYTQAESGIYDMINSVYHNGVDPDKITTPYFE